MYLTCCRLVPRLKYIIKESTQTELKLLRGKTIECISLIGLAVGSEKVGNLDSFSFVLDYYYFYLNFFILNQAYLCSNNKISLNVLLLKIISKSTVCLVPNARETISLYLLNYIVVIQISTSTEPLANPTKTIFLSRLLLSAFDMVCVPLSHPSPHFLFIIYRQSTRVNCTVFSIHLQYCIFVCNCSQQMVKNNIGYKGRHGDVNNFLIKLNFYNPRWLAI